MISKQALIICTDDRWENLEELIGTLAFQRLPQTIVIVSSSSPTTQIVEALHVLENSYSIKLFCIQGGLATKREKAIETVLDTCEIVHFIDDDFIPGRDYFVEIAKTFEQDVSLSGIGAFFRQEMNSPKFPKFRRFFLLDSFIKGDLLNSGFTTNAQAIAPSEKYPTKMLRVKWLSGCSMSFRVSALKEIDFPKELTGYSMDEDLIISYQMSKKGTLFVVPVVGCEHRTQPKELSDLKFRAMAFRARAHFVRNYFDGKYRWLAFTWASLGIFISLSHRWWRTPQKIVQFFRLIL